MANDNFYPGQVPGQPLGAGEGESPLVKPTAPNMDARTMASDIQSINTGGSAPKPYAPQTSPPENIPLAPTTPAAPAPDQSFPIPQMDVTGSQAPEPSPNKSSKGIFTALIVFVVVIGLAALGYFIIYPIFFATPVAIDNQNQPVSPPAVTSTTPEPIPIPSAPTSTHASLFITPADSQIEATVVTTGATLSDLILNITKTPNLTEIIYKNSDGSLAKFTDILKATAGLDLSSNSVLATAFNDQTVAGLIYIDGSSTRWLGFTVQLANETKQQNASTEFERVFETVSDYSGLFSSNPGTAQAWKDGQVSGVTGNRYLLFSNAGFAVDYGWVGNKLIIVSSYDGFKEAAKRLQ